MNSDQFVVHYHGKAILCHFPLKALDTFGNKLSKKHFFYSVYPNICIKQDNKSVKILSQLIIEAYENNERKNTPVSQVFYYFTEKLPLSQKTILREPFLTMCTLSTALQCSFQVSFYASNYFE